MPRLLSLARPFSPARRIPLGQALLGLLALRAQRRALRHLDDHLLRDIGLTPEAARIESERPLWDVPAHWQSRDQTR